MKKTNYKLIIASIVIFIFLIIIYFLNKKPKPENIPPLVGCKKAGCSGQLCVPSDTKDVITNCEWKSEYGCYRQAKCEKQSNGQCGFTKDESFQKCIDQAFSGFDDMKRP